MMNASEARKMMQNDRDLEKELSTVEGYIARAASDGKDVTYYMFLTETVTAGIDKKVINALENAGYNIDYCSAFDIIEIRW